MEGLIEAANNIKSDRQLGPDTQDCKTTERKYQK